MADGDTQFITRDASGDSSKMLGISVRALIVLSAVVGVVLTHLMITGAVLYNAVKTGDFSLVGSLTTIGEPYYSVVAVGIGFYLGTKQSPKP